MPTYVAFLGSHPIVSLAELSASFPSFAITHRFGDHAVVFTSAAVSAKPFMPILGGVFLLRGDGVESYGGAYGAVQVPAP